jgi:hypothetical protein
MSTKEPLFARAPSPFCESRITRDMFPKTVAGLEVVAEGDLDLAPLRLASFEHGGWLPWHGCLEPAARRGVKRESVRADWNRFVSRRLLPGYARVPIPYSILVDIARVGDFRIGYERYLAGPYGVPFEVLVHRLLREYPTDPRIRALVQDTLKAIQCKYGETADKERLRRDILRGIR